MGAGTPRVTPTKSHRSASQRDVPAGAAPRIVHGRAGDHPAVRHLLQTVFQAKSAVVFQSQIDDPFYEPSDRLLVKRGRRLLAHVHIAKRSMYFARGQAIEDGGLIATLSTRTPSLFARDGFFECGRPSYSQADVRSVLAHMPVEEPSLLGRQRTPLNLRLWRHFELTALMRLYRQNMESLIGPLHRSESYWRWLISREAFDQIVIAIDGPDRLSLEEGDSPIVGYAVVKGDQILELMAKPGHPTAARQLLARVCGDAIEHDFNSLVLHAPPQEPLHELLVLSGGSYHCRASAQQDTFMVSPLVEIATLLQRVCGELHVRAKTAELSRPCRLGLQLDDEKFCLQLTRRSVKVEPGSLGRHFLRASQADFLRLLLGHHHLDDAIARGQIKCSTRPATEIARAVFPNVSLWQPPWDQIP